MNFRYDNWLITKLVNIQETLSISDFKFEIAEEQDFLKDNFVVNPDTIYIVIKYLSDTKSINSTIQPIQLIILCEENSLEKSKIIFNALANDNNWTSVLENTEFVKFQFSNPVVLSNFNEVGYGYRSVMYMTCNLYIMEDVLDFEYIKIGNIDTQFISVNIAYSMSPNTQPMSGEYISSSSKSVSTLSISLTIPFLDNSTITDILDIIEETDSGADNFTISYKLTGKTEKTKNMKLISATIGSAKDNLPVLMLGFMK